MKEHNELIRQTILKSAENDIDKIYATWKEENRIDSQDEKYKYLSISLNKSIHEIKSRVSLIILTIGYEYTLSLNLQNSKINIPWRRSITSNNFTEFLQDFAFYPHGYPQFREEINQLMRKIYDYKIGIDYANLLMNDEKLSSYSQYFVKPIFEIAIANNLTLQQYNDLLNTDWKKAFFQYISFPKRSEEVMLFAKRVEVATHIETKTVGGTVGEYFASLKMYQYFHCEDPDPIISNNRKYYFELYPCLFELIDFKSFWDSNLYNQIQRAIDKGDKEDKLLIEQSLIQLYSLKGKNAIKKLQYRMPNSRLLSTDSLLKYDELNKDIFPMPLNENGKKKFLFDLTEEQVKNFVTEETKCFVIIDSCRAMADYLFIDLSYQNHDSPISEHRNALIQSLMTASTKNKKQLSSVYEALPDSFTKSRNIQEIIDAANDYIGTLFSPVILKRIFLLETNSEMRVDINSLFYSESIKNGLSKIQLDLLIRTFFANVSLKTVFEFSERWHHQGIRTKLASVKDFKNKEWEPLFKKQKIVVSSTTSDRQIEWSAIPLTSAKELRDEGKALNHCVGSYTQKCLYESPLSLIFSIRDENNQPQSTVEIILSQNKPESSKKYIIVASGDKRKPFFLIVNQHYGYHNRSPNSTSQFVLNTVLERITKEDLVSYEDILGLEAARKKRCEGKTSSTDLKMQAIDSVGYDVFNEEKYQQILKVYKDALPSSQMKQNLSNCILELQKLVDNDIRKSQREFYSLFYDLATYPEFKDRDCDRLFKAAETGNFSTTRRFLTLDFAAPEYPLMHIQRRGFGFKNIYWINRPNRDGNNCLMVAVLNGHLEYVKFLVKNGANINWQNEKGETALHIAVSKGQLAIVKVLYNELTDKDALTNLLNKNGETPLDLAYKFDRQESILLFLLPRAKILAREFLQDLHKKVKISYSLKEHLCRFNAILSSLIEATTKAILTLLAQAKAKEDGNLPDRNEIIETIFSADADNILINKLLWNTVINLADNDPINYPFDDGATFLIWAARLNNIDAVNNLFLKGAQIEIYDNNGHTALTHAIINNKYQVAQLLVSHGAEISSETLKLTARKNHPELLNLFKSELALRKAIKSLIEYCSVNIYANFQPENTYEKFFAESLAYDANHFYSFCDSVIEDKSYQGKSFTEEMFKKFKALDFVLSKDEDIKQPASKSYFANK